MSNSKIKSLNDSSANQQFVIEKIEQSEEGCVLRSALTRVHAVYFRAIFVGFVENSGKKSMIFLAITSDVLEIIGFEALKLTWLQ